MAEIIIPGECICDYNLAYISCKERQKTLSSQKTMIFMMHRWKLKKRMLLAGI